MESHLAEVFGYPVSDTTADAHRSREWCWCPFIKETCDRASHIDDYPLGICTLMQDVELYVICPHRFLGADSINGIPSGLENIALHYFGELKNLVILSNIKIPGYGAIDFVIVKHKPFQADIDDFVPVELCASLPTCTAELIQGLKDAMSERNVPATFYDVGIDFGRTAKRFLNQVFNKGIVYENWGIKSYWVIQEYLYTKLIENYGLKPGEYTEEHTCRLALQRYFLVDGHVTWGEPRYVSASVDGIYQAIRNDPTLPSKDLFVAVLNKSLRNHVKQFQFS